MSERKVFAIMDVTDSWDCPQVYGVYPTYEAAFKSLNVTQDIFDVFRGNTYEELNFNEEESIRRLVPDCDSWDELCSYELMEKLSNEAQKMAYRVQGKDIVETTFYDD